MQRCWRPVFLQAAGTRAHLTPAQLTFQENPEEKVAAPQQSGTGSGTTQHTRSAPKEKHGGYTWGQFCGLMCLAHWPQLAMDSGLRSRAGTKGLY
ncbi:Hypothetical predicted protein [Pelobates cultripes]|uniref:Uncharacterized protein n=1 Tax=Pelobates cultripes TaxID=61616 RepID=A0AAD1RT67_PELCU|nr:Hypothetical predicted protein [Pelobates cultripes]